MERQRKNIGRCTKEDVDTLQLIQNKVNCAAQACRPDVIPDRVSEEKARWFIQAAIDSLANYRWLETDWWNTMRQKYNLPTDREIWVDFNTYEFYIFE